MRARFTRGPGHGYVLSGGKLKRFDLAIRLPDHGLRPGDLQGLTVQCYVGGKFQIIIDLRDEGCG